MLMLLLLPARQQVAVCYSLCVTHYRDIGAPTFPSFPPTTPTTLTPHHTIACLTLLHLCHPPYGPSMAACLLPHSTDPAHTLPYPARPLYPARPPPQVVMLQPVPMVLAALC